MKKIILSLMLLFISLFTYAGEVDIRYNGKICKMEIFSSDGIEKREAYKVLAEKIKDFCKGKYIYNIDSVVIHNTLVFTVFYNNKSEVANED